MAPLLILAAASILASGAPSPAALEAGLVGAWHGALGYRDYGNNKLFELPVDKRIQALDDGATVIEISKFDDGPKTGFVYITGVSLFDSKAGTVTSASLRKGKPVEAPSLQTVRVDAYADPLHWTLVYEEIGQDDGKPARIRVTEVRDGDNLKRVEDVSSPSVANAPWAFRNQVRLTRSSG